MSPAVGTHHLLDFSALFGGIGKPHLLSNEPAKHLSVEWMSVIGFALGYDGSGAGTAIGKPSFNSG